MVSKRQKLARKKFKEEHPERFPIPEPTPPKDPNKKKNKKKKTTTDSKLKVKKSDSKESKSHRKHPLRVPGMRPGESCFICKALDHIARNCPEKAQWERNKVCLLCRQRGHSMKNCSDKNKNNTVDKKLCYNCGEYGHSLYECSLPREDGGTKFASCFICNEQGHLSKDCPKNTHGIYPKGGSCKICSGITHLARDCPNKGVRNNGFGIPSYGGNQERPKGKVTKIISGDDLEDDFTFDEMPNEPNDVAAASDDSKDITENVKSKKKLGPKVVNFVG
jgi:cofilin